MLLNALKIPNKIAKRSIKTLVFCVPRCPLVSRCVLKTTKKGVQKGVHEYWL
jgi:hypothetical protein